MNTKINDETFSNLLDYVENAVRTQTSPKRNATLGVLTRLFDCWGMYIPYVETILVNPVGTLAEDAWVYLHEAGHWAIDKNGIKTFEADEEQVCNDIAFIIMDRLGEDLYRFI